MGPWPYEGDMGIFGTMVDMKSAPKRA